MKLWEAIRAGAKLRPQCKGKLFRDGKSCALGAAYEGATGKTAALYSDIYELFPELRDSMPDGPEMSFWIEYRNDEGWTREQIADYLELQWTLTKKSNKPEKKASI